MQQMYYYLKYIHSAHPHFWRIRFEGRISQKFYTNCAVRFFVRVF